MRGMKRKIVSCDLCGKDITNSNERYKFKKYESSYANMEDFECMKWSRMDMCKLCFFDLLIFVGKRKDGADNE